MSNNSGTQSAASVTPTVIQPNMPSPIMPMFPDLLANAMPVPVPQMEWQSGILQDFLHNWKLLRVERATAREAGIAEGKNRLVKANLDTIMQITTFSGKLELEFKRINTDKEMLDVNLNLAKSQLIEQQLKNMLMQGEVKLNEVELKIKLKEMEEVLNGPQ